MVQFNKPEEIREILIGMESMQQSHFIVQS